MHDIKRSCRILRGTALNYEKDIIYTVSSCICLIISLSAKKLEGPPSWMNVSAKLNVVAGTLDARLEYSRKCGSF